MVSAYVESLVLWVTGMLIGERFATVDCFSASVVDAALTTLLEMVLVEPARCEFFGCFACQTLCMRDFKPYKEPLVVEFCYLLLV